MNYEEKKIFERIAGNLGDISLTNMGSFYEQDAYIPFSPFSVEQIKKCLKS